jgi:hypothetical protein
MAEDKAPDAKTPLSGTSTDAALLEKPEGDKKDPPAKISEGGDKKDPPPADKKEAPKTDTKETPKERIVPEKYELKLPEGSHLKPADIERISAHAKEQKLTAEEAQADLEIESDVVKTYVEGQKAAKADPEIGGDEFPKKAELIKRVVDRFAPEGFKKALETTGLGNHPELNRFLYRIGKSMADDQLVMPGSAPAPKKSVESLFYADADSKT